MAMTGIGGGHDRYWGWAQAGGAAAMVEAGEGPRVYTLSSTNCGLPGGFGGLDCLGWQEIWLWP